MQISVVIPVLNEESALPGLLEALLNQTRPPEEILVVDADSTDRSVDIVLEWGRKDQRVRYLKGRRGGCGIGRNIGIQAAACEWIVILDCGMIPIRSWLESLEGTQQRAGVQAVFGTCLYQPVSAFQKALCAVAWGSRPVPVVPCSLFHRSVFNSVGLFREDLEAVEDREWTKRFLEHFTSRCVMDDAVTPHYDVPGDIGAVYGKWFRYSRCVVRAGVLGDAQAVYFLGIPLAIMAAAYSWKVTIGLIILYAGLRGLVMPIRKGVSFVWLIEPANFVRILTIASVIDVAKALGFAVERYHMIRKIGFWQDRS
jgi:glycosyltransferase involved in cell wall biosynthesis